jgi:hypothetical protein
VCHGFYFFFCIMTVQVNGIGVNRNNAHYGLRTLNIDGAPRTTRHVMILLQQNKRRREPRKKCSRLANLKVSVGLVLTKTLSGG